MPRWHLSRSTTGSPRPGKIIHKVKPGETLTGIAGTYQVDVTAIKKWNGLERVNLIHPGQRLNIYR